MAVESNWLTHPRSRTSGTEILGDWGVASLRPLRIALEDGEQIVDVTPRIDATNQFDSVYQDFCQSVLDNRLPIVQFSEMLDVQRVMNALYEAAEKGREVTIAD